MRRDHNEMRAVDSLESNGNLVNISISKNITNSKQNMGLIDMS